jgi:hypothetical protein
VDTGVVERAGPKVAVATEALRDQQGAEHHEDQDAGDEQQGDAGEVFRVPQEPFHPRSLRARFAAFDSNLRST